MRCKKCKKEIEHPRRGMCLNCYRKVTGLSKTKIAKTISQPIQPKPKIKLPSKLPSLVKEELKQNNEVKEVDKTKKKSSAITTSDVWWENYLDADILKQQQLLSELPLLRELAKNGFPDISNIQKYQALSKEDLAKEQEKFNSHMLVTMLYSYIEDFISYRDNQSEYRIK